MISTHRRSALGLIPVSGALLALLLLGAPGASASSNSGSGSGSSSSDDGALHDLNDDHGGLSASGSDDDSQGEDDSEDLNDDNGGLSASGSDDDAQGEDDSEDLNDDNGGASSDSDDDSGAVASGSTGTPTTLPASVSTRKGKSPRVLVRQQCGAIATKLKVKNDHGRTEVEYELDQNVVGQTWTLSLARNGTEVATATRVTKAPSGSFGWHVRTDNPAGSDAFTVTSTSGPTSCVITATL
jgi:hypothetical protein